jgi:hypothetical protein
MMALLANKYVRGAAGILAAVIVLLIVWTKLQSVLADRDRVRAERDNIAAEREKDKLAYENMATRVKRLTAQLSKRKCDGDYKRVEFPDGRVEEECKGLSTEDLSTSTTIDSEEAPKFAPRRPPPETPKRSRWWLHALLGIAVGVLAGTQI